MEINAPVDRGRKLNIHKTFRRRPGRLLNVLCTFNLRLVSTGTINFSGRKPAQSQCSALVSLF